MDKIYSQTNCILEQMPKTAALKHRGISDIIVTLLLLSITVIGGVMVFTVFQGAEITENAGSLAGSSRDESRPVIKIVGHDTRDGTNLAGISGLSNNVSDKKLTKGTDMIVLQIRNTGVQDFTVDRVSINDIRHSWDSSGSGTIGSSNQPDEGTFWIVENDSATIRTTPIVFLGSEVRLVLKLSDCASCTDIDLSKELRVVVFPSQGKEIFQIIPSGSVG